MNERIKELYTEASAWALHNYPPPVNPFEWEDLRNNKFAEMIVRECAGVGSNIVLNETEDNDMGVFLGIKQHFGVEE